VEITCLRQYIGETIVYFLNRLGVSNWMSLIQKVNKMRQYIGAVIAERTFCPRFAYSSRDRLLTEISGSGNKEFYWKRQVQISNNP
jgi:hypothetical protein